MNDLIKNIDKIHSTDLGVERISKNLNIKEDVISYCKKVILDNNSKIYKKGKNWYCENGKVRVTINSYSYTIITAHII